VSRFEECGIKVTSDGEAAYAADKRAIVLIVLSPELFKCAELVDEIAKHLDRQAPGDPRAAAGSAVGKDAHLKKALLGGAAEAHTTTADEDLLSVDDVPLEMTRDAETKLEAFEAGASVVFGVRSARPGPSAETHSASLIKTPLGFGVALDERNKIIGVSPDSQAARGGSRWATSSSRSTAPHSAAWPPPHSASSPSAPRSTLACAPLPQPSPRHPPSLRTRATRSR
jgi:hypothetical protein